MRLFSVDGARMSNRGDHGSGLYPGGYFFQG